MNITNKITCNSFSALVDQSAQYQEEEGSWSAKELRDYLCFSLLNNSTLHTRLNDGSVEGVRHYVDKMCLADEPGDDVMVLTAATALRRRIRVYPVFKSKHPVINFNPVNGIQPKTGDFHLLRFSKQHFEYQGYMSLINDTNKRNSLPTEDTPLESTGHNFSSQKSNSNLEDNDSFSSLFDHSGHVSHEEVNIVQNIERGTPLKLSELRRKKKEDVAH